MKASPLFDMPVDPYGWHLYLFRDREAYAAFVAEREPTATVDVYDCAGWCVTSYSNNAVYLGVFSAGTKTLVHELTHAVTRILEHVGVPLTGDASEAMAYLMGHLYERCKAALTAAHKRKPAKR